MAAAAAYLATLAWLLVLLLPLWRWDSQLGVFRSGNRVAEGIREAFGADRGPWSVSALRVFVVSLLLLTLSAAITLTVRRSRPFGRGLVLGLTLFCVGIVGYFLAREYDRFVNLAPGAFAMVAACVLLVVSSAAATSMLLGQVRASKSRRGGASRRRELVLTVGAAAFLVGAAILFAGGILPGAARSAFHIGFVVAAVGAAAALFFVGPSTRSGIVTAWVVGLAAAFWMVTRLPAAPQLARSPFTDPADSLEVFVALGLVVGLSAVGLAGVVLRCQRRKLMVGAAGVVVIALVASVLGVMPSAQWNRTPGAWREIQGLDGDGVQFVIPVGETIVVAIGEFDERPARFLAYDTRADTYRRISGPPNVSRFPGGARQYAGTSQYLVVLEPEPGEGRLLTLNVAAGVWNELLLPSECRGATRAGAAVNDQVYLVCNRQAALTMVRFDPVTEAFTNLGDVPWSGDRRDPDFPGGFAQSGPAQVSVVATRVTPDASVPESGSVQVVAFDTATGTYRPPVLIPEPGTRVVRVAGGRNGAVVGSWENIARDEPAFVWLRADGSYEELPLLIASVSLGDGVTIVTTNCEVVRIGTADAGAQAPVPGFLCPKDPDVKFGFPFLQARSSLQDRIAVVADRMYVWSLVPDFENQPTVRAAVFAPNED